MKVRRIESNDKLFDKTLKRETQIYTNLRYNINESYWLQSIDFNIFNTVAAE